MTPEVERLTNLLAKWFDPGPCQFDHHGGCQEHGFLDLEPGEKCPNEQVREILAAKGGAG
ncbi:hypothetical protein A3N99_02755 [Mycobacteroides abscessus]|uniref:hypothetical protein n=1 Tax=Mycobacteroides abscessus TaxID=36809 RepID=UPI00078D302D|nr:hypothetical protein [Mycobacteroides abscessus]AMU39230.1 hypothetical protein A3N99_02755 [Mycobacteroides abscessus]